MTKPTISKVRGGGQRPAVTSPAAVSPAATPVTGSRAVPAAASKPATRIEGKPAAEPTPQAIAEAAYFIWLERGGNETVNWLEAESMLRRQTLPRQAASS